MALATTLSKKSETGASNEHPVHPLGSKARVLLSSVFGPYAQDDEFGSAKINPMELYHNQVTRTQGPFSLRMNHRSWGIMMIQCNITAPCNLLDFPTRERFISELKDNTYDIVGISSILVNVLKVKEMCRLVRKHQPQATIVIGGHIANLTDLTARVDADHVVQGEGINWFRAFLGEDTEQPFKHPVVLSPVNTRTMGVKVSDKEGEAAAAVIPSVGCPMGCNFCSTSAMFGGKGKSRTFYQTGDELFEVLVGLERKIKARSFFVMDENFLINRGRALKLLELMEKHNKSWSFYLFASANVLRKYTMDELMRIGVSWIWMGLEGDDSEYGKLKGIDTRELVAELQENGVRVLGSSIIGFEDHTVDNIDAAIDDAVRYNTAFHQFMLYTPLPGTPLHKDMTSKGLVKDESEVDLTKIHGQLEFNFRHPHIKNGEETEILTRAFDRDFEVNGPSVARIARTTLSGWQKHKSHPDARVRERFRWEARELATSWISVVSASAIYYRDNEILYPKLKKLRDDIIKECGLKARIVSIIGGRFMHHSLKKEIKRMAAGRTHEPPTFYETNDPN
ncbi:MAG: B12-binding domain-containing radical SAM protein, partial [Planctomycetota bacterium]